MTTNATESTPVTQGLCIPEVIRQRALSTPVATAYWGTDAQGEQYSINWREYWELVELTAAGLKRQNLSEGDVFAIMMPNSLHWEVLQNAALRCGATVVGIEPHATLEHKQFILTHSKAVALAWQRFDSEELSHIDPNSRLQLNIFIEPYIGPYIEPYKGAKNETTTLLSIDQLQQEATADCRNIDPPQPTAQATLIYTSGTTGQPKAIGYTHQQVLDACESIIDAYSPLDEKDSAICWLPLANLFQRVMNQCAAQVGAATYMVSDPLQIMSHLKIAQPTIFIGVPRFYEKLYEGMQQSLQRIKLNGLVAQAGVIRQRLKSGGKPRLLDSLRYRCLDWLILKRLKSSLGGRVRFMVTGSAPCRMPVLRFFDSIGLPLLEAYGMSENIIPNSSNRLIDYRLGSVGKPLKSNDIMIDAQGEVSVKGSGVLTAYTDSDSQPEFNENGYLKTGDNGFFDEDGYLFLTGRNSDLIKTSTGRRIAAAAIEQTLVTCPMVDQAVVLGQGRKHLIAIITLAQGTLNNIKTGEALTQVSRQTLSQQLSQVNSKLEHHQQVLGCLVLLRPFSIGNGELTANLKLRRNAIADRFARQIDTLYENISAYSTKNTNQAIVLNLVNENSEPAA